MRNRNWKLLGLWLALALLCACLWGGAAVAEGGQPNWMTVTNAEIEDGAVGGCTFYYVEIDLNEEDTFQWCWLNNTEDRPEDWRTVSVAELPAFDDGGKHYIKSGPGFNEETGTYNLCDVLYYRRSESDGNIGHIVFNYTFSDAKAVITNEVTNLSLMTPFTMNFGLDSEPEGQTDVSYKVGWKMPSGETLAFLTDDSSLSFEDGMQVEWGDTFDLDRILGYVGEYEAWVTPRFGDLQGQDSEHVTFTVAAPEADERIRLETPIEGDEEGKRYIPLHGDIEYSVWAPGADGNRVEVYFGDGEMNEKWPDDDDDEDNDHYGWDEGEHGFHYEDAPEYRGDEPKPHCYTVYARAMFEDEWVYSNSIDFLVYVDDAIEGEVSYRVDNPTVARDGLVQVEVDPVEGAEFCEAFIDTDDGWIAGSHWVDM